MPFGASRPDPSCGRGRGSRALIAAGALLVALTGCSHSSPSTGSATPATTTTSTLASQPATSAPTASTTTAVATTTVVTAPPTTTDPTVAATAAWPGFAAGQGAQRSAVATTAAGRFAAVSYNVVGNGTTPHVVIAGFVGGAWSKLADLTLDIGGEVEPTGTPVTVIDLTSSPTPDFVVTVNYNSGDASTIASAAGGTWHLLQFHGSPIGGGTATDEIIDATITGHAITQSANDCNPDSASGHQISTTFSYSPATGKMEAVG